VIFSTVKIITVKINFQCSLSRNPSEWKMMAKMLNVI